MAHIFTEWSKKSKITKLVVIDDFNLLCRSTKTSNQISEWLKEFKKHEITVVLLIKSKNWKNYVKEDLVDLELRLNPYESNGFLGFRMDIKRSRNIAKEHLKPMLFDMIDEDGTIRLIGKQYQEDITLKIAFLIAHGYSQSEIAKSLGVHQSTVSRRFDRALNDSLLLKHGKQYILSETGQAQTKGMSLPDD